MPIKNNIPFLLLLLLPFFYTTGNAQGEISSPYSGFGPGVLSNTVNGTMASMGGLSYALQSPYFINYKNPASYVAFDSLSFIADASLSITSSTLKTSLLTQKGSNARPNYLMIGLPVNRYWRTSAGVLPFSDVGYKIHDVRENVSFSYDGSGGLMQLYWGNAFKIYKGLSIGLNISYMFGNLKSIRSSEFTDANFYNTRITQSLLVDGIYLSGGIQYFHTIGQNHKIGVGVVYENSAYIWEKENLLINRYMGVYNSSSVYDTVKYVDGARGRMIIPQSIGGGFTYTFKNKFLIGADITWQNWAKFQSMGRKDSLKNCLIGSVGIRFTPNPNSNKYLNRINLHAGARYSSGYLHLNNQTISEFGVTFGIGLPIRTFSSQSTIHIMAEYGQMGTTRNELILQNYFKLSFSFILHEKWYQRVRLE